MQASSRGIVLLCSKCRSARKEGGFGDPCGDSRRVPGTASLHYRGALGAVGREGVAGFESLPGLITAAGPGSTRPGRAPKGLARNLLRCTREALLLKNYAAESVGPISHPSNPPFLFTLLWINIRVDSIVFRRLTHKNRAPQTPQKSENALRMNIAHAMCFVIQRSHSLTEILDNAVRLIAREMGTDVCSIYLLDPRDHRLRLMATQGLDKAALGKVTLAVGEGLTGSVVKEMRYLAVEDASSHPRFRYFPETKEEQFQSFLGVPLAIRNRPVGAIVVQTRDRRSYSPEEIQTLTTISAQLVGVVENARLIDSLDRGEAGTEYLHEVRSWRMLGQVAPREHQKDFALFGSPASPGLAIGVALFRGSHDLTFDLHDLPFQGEETELRRVNEAFEATRKEILKIQEAAEREAGEEHALIFSSHLLLLNDPVLVDRIKAAILTGVSAPAAIYDSLEHFGKKLQNISDPYIQDRVEDIFDLRSRILGQLLSVKQEPSNLSDKIVVARGIPPSLVVELKAEGARGIITERGGPTSHGALLARSMGIPAVTGILDIVLAVRSGDTLIVDGRTGKVTVAPSEASLHLYEETLEKINSRKVSNLRYRDLPARTLDGVSVSLQANIGVAADLALARENGAEGIGLFIAARQPSAQP